MLFSFVFMVSAITLTPKEPETSEVIVVPAQDPSASDLPNSGEVVMESESKGSTAESEAFVAPTRPKRAKKAAAKAKVSLPPDTRGADSTAAASGACVAIEIVETKSDSIEISPESNVNSNGELVEPAVVAEQPTQAASEVPSADKSAPKKKSKVPAKAEAPVSQPELPVEISKMIAKWEETAKSKVEEAK
jgi:hypothetical protein